MLNLRDKPALVCMILRTSSVFSTARRKPKLNLINLIKTTTQLACWLITGVYLHFYFESLIVNKKTKD